MKQLAYLVLIAMLMLSSPVGNARNTILHVSIQEALALPEAAERLDSSIQLFFGD